MDSKCCEKTSVTGLRVGVADEQTRVVLCDAGLEITACRADIVTAVGTTQHVEICTAAHGPPSSFETPRFARLLRMRAGREPSQLQESDKKANSK
jgi:hypothetical protein